MRPCPDTARPDTGPATAAPSRTGVLVPVLALIGTMWGLLQPLVAPALPDIARTFGASTTDVSWVLTAFLLSAAITTPITGRLGDIAGRRTMLLVVLSAVAVGGVVSAVSGSLVTLVVGRVLQGVGAGVFPLVFGIIRDDLPRERVPGAIGLVSVTLGVGGGVGIIVSGLVVDNLGFRWLFWLTATAMVACILATAAFVRDVGPRAGRGINWWGSAAMSVGLGSVLFGLTKSSTWGWGSPGQLVLLAVGASAIALWVASESRSRNPLVDMRTMRLRAVWTTDLTGLMLGAGMFSAFVLVPQLAQNPASSGVGFGADVTHAGLLLLPLSVAVFLVGTQAGRVERRFGAKPALVLGAVLSAAAYLMMYAAHDTSGPIYVATGILGIGVGLGFAAMTNVIVAAVPLEETGAATGVNTVARTVGSALGSAITGTLLASSAVDGHLTDAGFSHAFLVAAGALILAVLAAAFIPTSVIRPTSGAPLR